jgi:hypothetical protein
MYSITNGCPVSRLKNSAKGLKNIVSEGPPADTLETKVTGRQGYSHSLANADADASIKDNSKSSFFIV